MSKYIILIATLLVVSGLYLRESSAYFCGFDDMNEWHRIAFTEHPGFANDMSTMPYLGYKYRPLTWTINRLTFEWGNGSPVVFRTRNLVFHLCNIILLYVIAMMLFNSLWVAGTAIILFGLHPFAAQSVSGGVWTVTPSAFLMLSAWLCFLLSVRKTRVWLLWLSLSMFLGWLGILMYDAVLFLFGLPYAYAGVMFLARKKPLDRSLLAAATILTVLFVGAYFGLRGRFLPPGHANPPSLTAPFKNAVIYAGSYLLLIDPVLAHEWFQTPFPSEALHGEMTIEWIFVTILPAACILPLLLFPWRYIRDRLRAMDDWPMMIFLFIATVGSFSAFLLFTDHASETYLYLPTLFVTLMASRLMCQLLKPEEGRRLPYIICMTVLIILFGCAVTVRNNSVVACGAIAQRILTGFPTDRLRQGSWRIVLSPAPGEPPSAPYGMYGHSGIDTLGIGEYGGSAIERSLQSEFANPNVSAEVVSPEQFEKVCADPSASPSTLCVEVHKDGDLSFPSRTTPASPSTSSR